MAAKLRYAIYWCILGCASCAYCWIVNSEQYTYHAASYHDEKEIWKLQLENNIVEFWDSFPAGFYRI